MQTLVFAATLANLAGKLRLREIHDLLVPMYDPDLSASNPHADGNDARFSELLLSAHTAFSLASEEEKQVAKAFDLDKVFRPALIGQFIADFKRYRQWHQVHSDRGFWTLYYAARSALKVSDAVNELLVQSKYEGVTDAGDVITFELSDYGENGIPPARFAIVLSEIGELYNAVSQATGDSEAGSPAIIFTDSGTSFAIGLRGGGKCISAIADTFARAFNAVRFGVNDRFERNLQSADAALDFNARVRARVEAGEIDPNTAEDLIRATNAHVQKLLEQGVTVDAILDPDVPTRQQVLQSVRNRRLLGPGQPEDSSGEIA